MGGEVFTITARNANGSQVGEYVTLKDEDEAMRYTWQLARHSHSVEVRVDHDVSWFASKMARQSSEG